MHDLQHFDLQGKLKKEKKKIVKRKPHHEMEDK